MKPLSSSTRTRLCGLSFYGPARVATAVVEMNAEERKAAETWLLSYAVATWQRRTYNYLATNYGVTV